MCDEMDQELLAIVCQIIEFELKEQPLSIQRCAIGLCNEVYLVTISHTDVVVRFNRSPKALLGTERYIPLFASLDIPVPQLLASSYSLAVVPVAYQILSKIPGRDITDVIHTLTEDQLCTIAQNIAMIFQKLSRLPTNGKYGFIDISEDEAKNSWLDVIDDLVTTINERNKKSGVIEARHLEVLNSILAEHRDYFIQCPSIFYFDDLSAKNVMIDNGRFVGLVDLDNVAYGDPLEAVGRIEGSWFGTSYGRFYTDEIEKALGLTTRQRRIVTMYAITNYIFWLAMKGVRYNSITSLEIDWDSVKDCRNAIDSLILKYHSMSF